MRSGGGDGDGGDAIPMTSKKGKEANGAAKRF